jgi:DNA-binding transcriptional LysR family regulator
MVTHGQLDIAIVAQPFEHSEGIHAEKLIDEELILFGKKLPKNMEKAERKRALLNRPWVTMSIPDSIVNTFWKESFDGEAFPWNEVQVVACLDHILAIPKVVTTVENSLCIVPQQIVANHQGYAGYEFERASRQKNGLYLIARAGCLELKRFALVAEEIKRLAANRIKEQELAERDS